MSYLNSTSKILEFDSELIEMSSISSSLWTQTLRLVWNQKVLEKKNVKKKDFFMFNFVENIIKKFQKFTYFKIS